MSEMKSAFRVVTLIFTCPFCEEQWQEHFETGETRTVVCPGCGDEQDESA